MAARLDGRLDDTQIADLEEHMAMCRACRADWQRMSAVDQLFRSASSVAAPPDLHIQVTARVSRREEARRAVAGGLALALGAAALALLTLTPIALGLLGNVGAAPALLIGGMETITQLLLLLEAVSRMLLVLLDRFAVPLILLGLGSFTVALALNGLWIAAMRRLRVVER
jgi:predicted anti-sigma-YlaC factor YlaD